MSWFKKLLPSKIGTDNKEKKGVPEGLWIKCPSCEKILYKAEYNAILEFVRSVNIIRALVRGGVWIYF